MAAYAELVCRSNYSFLGGASHPEELVDRAAELGLSALALTDDDGFYGVVKAHLQAKVRGLPFVVGAALTLEDGPPLVAWAQDAVGYANLCELISESRLTHPKGEAGLPWRRVAERAQGLAAVVSATDRAPRAAGLADAFGERLHVGVCRGLHARDEERVARAVALARDWRRPLLAHNDVHTHRRERQPLQDVMTAIRLGTTVARAGTRLFPNAEHTLKGPEEMAALFADLPDAVARTVEVARGCAFALDELHYGFSREELPPGQSPTSWLAVLVEEGLHFRYPEGVPDAVRRQIEKELGLIATLGYEGYFLALWDIVRFARQRGILCQGRGSAANSAVCFALQITAIDPVRMGLLFERFLSLERREPPDIDVDFEHHRREEVLQYVYEKHGRHRAAMVCEHICFRERLAVREVGKALGLSLDQVDKLAKATEFGEELGAFQLHQAGLSPGDRAVQHTLSLARQLTGMPRHLSIHVGGFVITDTPLTSLAPVENAAMAGRTVVQWEKDDLSALDILKVDLLSLGMLTVVSRTLELVKQTTGRQLSMATVPAEDPAVYQMLCEGDSIGVFQVESRAQQNMLPRLKPRCFYDLVVEIAIIRPGPIVGQMVHPYLKRREGLEPVTYPSEAVRDILSRTLGIPLFQEQAMRLAMVAAGFSVGDADRLRRALSHKRAEELVPPFRARFIEGCVERGYERDFAERCFNQFKGFSHYGFPESHSASFALIAYVTSWLKLYYPAAFCAALLDAQPMGFYAPHTLVEDARRHGVEVRPVDSERLGLEEPAGGVGPRRGGPGRRAVRRARPGPARAAPGAGAHQGPPGDQRAAGGGGAGSRRRLHLGGRPGAAHPAAPPRAVASGPGRRARWADRRAAAGAVGAARAGRLRRGRSLLRPAHGRRRGPLSPHDGQGARGRRLRHRGPVAGVTPGGLVARAARRTPRADRRRAGPGEGGAGGDDGGAGDRPPAPAHGQGLHLPVGGGRDGHRQLRARAGALRAVPHRDRRHRPGGGPRAGGAGGPGGQPEDRSPRGALAVTRRGSSPVANSPLDGFG